MAEVGLRADCARCSGLCCVVPAYTASADFAVTKPAGRPCLNLVEDFRCGIHTQLRERGFPGCTVYDCFGAGQQLTQVTFRGRDWRGAPELAESIFAVYPVLRELHELLWHVTQPLSWPTAGPVHAELEALRVELTDLVGRDPEELLAVAVPRHWRAADPLLRRASELLRAESRGPERRGADLIGRDLRRTRLSGANLRGAYLIGADLREVDLGLADVIGADLRGTNVGGAELSRVLFLTQFQVNAARGDAATCLPEGLDRPAHWVQEGLPPVRAGREAGRGRVRAGSRRRR